MTGATHYARLELSIPRLLPSKPFTDHQFLNLVSITIFNLFLQKVIAKIHFSHTGRGH